jgi:carboxypeptidase family protein
MRAFIPAVLFLILLAAPAAVADEAGSPAELRVTVIDPTGAALVKATVTVTDSQGVAHHQHVDGKGVAVFEGLTTGSYQVKVEAEAFETSEATIELKKAATAITIRLPLAGLKEDVVVRETPEDAGTNAFTTSLSEQEIAELPDDPDDLEEVLMEMAGPGATIRVNGFRGGRLPPKSQIRQIRFRTNSYSADTHEAGGVGIEIITKPGATEWRGRTNFGFRDESLNARNYFAPRLGPEQYRRVNFSADGPLVKNKTSVAITIDGNDNYDSQTIVAAVPGGIDLRAQVRRPFTALNGGVRVDQAIGSKQTLSLDFSSQTSSRDNLGVGNFDLPSRAYTRDQRDTQFRVSLNGLIAPKVAHELKAQYLDTRARTTSASDDPAIVVIDAFSTGGAGQNGDRTTRELEIDDSLEFSPAKKHTMRVGVQLESFWVNSLDQENFNGTFTFSSNAAYTLGLPSTYRQRTGTGIVEYSQWQAAWYVQDDWTIRKTFALSLGLRHELQAHLDDGTAFAPRVGFTWTPGKYTVRGGWGIFNDWYTTSLYEQTLLVNGITQQDLVIQNPGFPDPSAGAFATVLPPSIIRASDSLSMPWLHQASIGVERTFGALRVQTNYFMQRGFDQFRSRNVNAPVDGVRPDVLAGNITVLESTGQTDTDRWTVNVNYSKPDRRIFLGGNYQLARAYNFTDSPYSLPANNYDLAAEWGPSSRDVRHRLFSFLAFPLPMKFRGSLMTLAQSALPYTVITGIDNNRDTVLNDRPEGEGRNGARGSPTWNMNARVSRAFFFGPQRQTDGGPGAPPVRAGGGGGRRGGVGPGGPDGPGGGGGGGPMMMREEGAGRYSVEFYAQAMNVLNHTNFQNYAGSLRSPYFGEPTSAAPPRRIEVGINFGF